MLVGRQGTWDHVATSRQGSLIPIRVPLASVYKSNYLQWTIISGMNTFHTLAIMINNLCSMITPSLEIPPSSTSDAVIPDMSVQPRTASISNHTYIVLSVIQH